MKIKTNYFFNYFKIFIAISLMWIVMSDQGTLTYNALGIISVFLTLIISLKMKIISSEFHFLKLKFFIYIYILIRDIAKSGIKIVQLVFSEDLKINPNTTEINVSNLNKQEKVMFANLITMTPGTFVISIDKDKFLIHAIDKRNLNFHNNEKIANLLRKMR